MTSTTVTSFIEPASAVPGIIAISVGGLISLIAVAGLVGYLVFHHIRRTAAEKAGHVSAMGEAHMTAYFYSLLAASMLKAMSVIMSIRWTYLPMDPGAFCTLQSGLKFAGNVGTATWSMVISIHIFNLLFMSLRPNKWSLPAVVGGVWSFIIADVLIGPAAFRDFFVPYDGQDGDGTSCWVAKKHQTARFLLEYVPTGLTVLVSILLLTATLLYLRGNIVYVNRRLKLRLRLHGDDAWHNKQMRDDLDRSILATVRRLIWFPICYFMLWIPVMVSRLAQINGRDQPYAFVAFSLTVYALTGFADVVLFVVTRKVILKKGAIAPAYADLEKERTAKEGPQPGSAILTSMSAPFMKEKAHKKAVSGQISLPRPLILQSTIDGAPLSRTDSTGSETSYKSTTGLLTGSSMPHFDRESPLPPPPMLALPPLVPNGPPKRLSDVSMIASSMSLTTASSATDSASSFSAGGTHRRMLQNGLGIGALQNGPKLNRSGSASSTSSIPPRTTDSHSVYSTLDMPTARSLAADTYTAQAHILSAYGSGGDDQLTSRAPTTAVSSNESFVGGAPSAMPSTRAARRGSGGTFGAAVRAAGTEMVTPVTSEETFKAQLYGTRFSLVAGPSPVYNYEAPRQV